MMLYVIQVVIMVVVVVYMVAAAGVVVWYVRACGKGCNGCGWCCTYVVG